MLQWHWQFTFPCLARSAPKVNSRFHWVNEMISITYLFIFTCILMSKILTKVQHSCAIEAAIIMTLWLYSALFSHAEIDCYTTAGRHCSMLALLRAYVVKKRKLK